MKAIGFAMAVVVALGFAFLRESRDDSGRGIEELSVRQNGTEAAEVELAMPVSDADRIATSGDIPQATPESLPAAIALARESENRSEWTVYQWRELHAQSWLVRYAEATGLADQVTALKAVDFIAIANILDGRGLGLVNSTITPANSGNSWGFSLNGVTYEFQNNDFPEFQELTALDSVLYTRAKEGEKREISDELHQKVLDRLAESFSVSERLGKGPSYHAR